MKQTTSIQGEEAMNDFKVPEQWGSDPLTTFIDAANQNTYSISVHYQGWFATIIDIDSLFVKFLDKNLNLPLFYESFLLIRGHSSYRGAVRLGTSGQLSEAYSILRGCLEYALYAFYFFRHPEHIQTWIGRDEDDEGKKRARRQLTNAAMLVELEQADRSLGVAARHLYDFTIDLGAHPNRKTVTLAMAKLETEDSVFFRQAQLNTDPLQMTCCLKTTVQVGICALKLFRLVFRQRFDLLGITDDIDNLARRRIDGISL